MEALNIFSGNLSVSFPLLLLVPHLRSSPFISVISGAPSREAGSRALGCLQDQGWEGSRGRLPGDCPFSPQEGEGHVSSVRSGEGNSPWMCVAHQMQRGKHPSPVPTSESLTSITYMPFVCLFCPSLFFRGAYLQVAVTNHSVLSFQNLESLWKKGTEVFLGSGKIFSFEKQDC